MEEKIYNTMSVSGIINLTLGIVGIVAGIAGGILLIISGSKLIDKKSGIMF